MKITKSGKFLLFGVIPAAALICVKLFLFDTGKIFTKTSYKSMKIENVDLPTAPANAKDTVPPIQITGTTPANMTSPEIKFELMAWNSQMGLMYANGGATPAVGSLMQKEDVNLHLLRQDDCNVMAQDMIKFATEYKKDPSTTEGTQICAVMGDGSAAFLAGLNKELEKVGPDYKAVIIGSCGRSNGEDKFLGLPAWRSNPQAAKGALVATVVRDGDWNIVIKWAADNNIPVNPDDTTYDPNAINFVNAKDYVDSANLYIAGKSETRDIVVDGRRTGQKWTGKINGVSTWTPADVNVAEQKGGLVPIVSTREYASQMPNAIITVNKFAKDHRDTMVNMLDAITKGGDQVRCYSAALNFAGDVSAKVYNEQTGAYWVKYYTGISEEDKQGLMVDLGGSMAFNLSDNLNLFGITPGSVNTFKIVYNTFGNIVVKMYPNLVPSIPAADTVFDTSYLQTLANRAPVSSLSAGETHTYNAAGMTQKVSERAWSIEFQTGSAQLSPKSIATLREIADSAVVSSGLSLKITGHTDNSGTPDGNQILSEARANSVKTWLMQNYSSVFPSSRVIALGKGQSEPIADNSTAAGKARNRRVVVTMGM